MAFSLFGERPAAVARSFNPVPGLLRFLGKMRHDRAKKAALAELLELEEFRLYDLGINRQDVVEAMHRPHESAGEALAARRASAARMPKRGTCFE
jgi:uncharacterized protein YjiS (DUF1127 family)